MSESAIRAAEQFLYSKYDGNDRHAFILDPHVQTAAGGIAIVRVQQHFGGIPLFGGDLAFHIANSEIINVLGDVAESAPESDGRPDISATEAVRAAIAHFAAKSDRSECRVKHRSLRGKVPTPSTIASFPFPSRPTVVRLGRSWSYPAAYLVYYRSGGALCLVWVVRVKMRHESYLVLISALGESCRRVMLCTRWSSTACFGTVFSFNHAAGRRRVEFPMPAAEYPPFLAHEYAAFFGRPWMTLDQTAGNNAFTFSGATATLLRALPSGPDIVFPVTAATSAEQAMLNAFYYCNFLHEFFLMLGFGEEEGNFQLENFSASGDGDRLQVHIFTSTNRNLGSMDARDDGDRARMSLGRAPSGELSGLHPEVMIHEYAHGVVHRMIGGRIPIAALVEQQSQAMDEGWADYFAITVRNHYTTGSLNYRFGEWAGVTVRDYAPNVARRYDNLGRAPNRTINGAGEIFAAALIRFNEFLGTRLQNATRGHCIGWRAVVESLRLIEADPHFLQGREALMGAIDGLAADNNISTAEANHARAAAREAFARYGMGRNAGTPNARFGGQTADFDPT